MSSREATRVERVYLVYLFTRLAWIWGPIGAMFRYKPFHFEHRVQQLTCGECSDVKQVDRSRSPGGSRWSTYSRALCLHVCYAGDVHSIRIR